MSTRSEKARETMESPTDEARIQRQWRGIQERRAKKRLSSSVRGLGLATGGLALAAALALALLGSPSDESLAAADGSTLVGEFAAVGEPRAVDLEDGSHLELAPGSRLSILDNSGSRISLHLAQGRTRFDVEPGGPRRWIIEAGPLTVEVVGTAFTVTREGAQASVEVHRGAVIVRGQGVPDRVQRLGPGDRVAVGEPVAEPSSPAISVAGIPVAALPTPASVVVAPVLEPAEIEAPAPRTRRPRLTAAEILASADTARRGGDLATAIRLLRRIDRERADDPSAGLAAFTLGRIELEQRDDPAAAARAFARAQQLGVPSALEDDVAVRLVEARVRGGDSQGAGRAARAYLEAHPTGRHAHEMQQWVDP